MAFYIKHLKGSNEKDNPIQMNLYFFCSRIMGITGLFDVWALLIRLLTAVISSLFMLPALVSYDIKLSGKLAKRKLLKYEDREMYNFNGVYSGLS
jgi:hypothetical protein